MDSYINLIELFLSENDIEKLLKKILKNLKSIVNADRISLFLYNEAKSSLESVFLDGNEIKKIEVPISNTSLAGFSFIENKVLNIKDTYNEEEIKSISPNLKHDKSWDKKTGYKTQSILVIPLYKGDKKLGVLQLINKLPYFSKEDEELVVKISKFISIALDNALNILKLNEKQTEKKIVIDNISEAVVITDLNLKVIDINTSFLEMIGYRMDIDSIIGNNIQNILPEFGKHIDEKIDNIKKTLISEEIITELIRIKIFPVVIREFGEEKLKGLILIFKYPKG